ncbi:MAG: protein kinase [Planctomycetes bacterium]|nr:protein kinase [Planctomycetota bacterium]
MAGGGRRLGDYELLRELGRGGMGVVYAARHPRHGEVALKLTLGRAIDAEGLARLRREVEALRRLDHPNVVPVRDAGQHDGHCYVAMALVEGESLRARLQRGPLPPREAAAMALGLARAVAHIHAAGVLHRDIKPHNVLLARDGRPVLVDFGLARLALDAQRLTRTGEVVGTPEYMAPEQALGGGRPGPAIDVYGIGATLYEALCGRAPYAAPTPVQVFAQVMAGPPLPPSRVAAGADPGLERLCLACMERDPARRPAIDDLVAALRPCPRRGAAAPRPAPPAGRPRRGRACRGRPPGGGLVTAWVFSGAGEAPPPPVPPPATPEVAAAEPPAPAVVSPSAEEAAPAPPIDLLRRAALLSTQGRDRAREALTLVEEAARREPTGRVLLACAAVQRRAARAGVEEPPDALLAAAEARLGLAARAGADPDLVDAARARLARDREELADFARLRREAATPAARFEVARRCRQLGRREEALERLAALAPEFGATAGFHAAGELSLMGRLAEARSAYEAALAEAEGQSVIWCRLRLAQVCWGLGEWAAVHGHVEAALPLATDPADVARLLLERARALASTGRAAEALEPADLALELFIEAGVAHAETALPMALVAEGLRATGQAAPARAACEQAVVLAREVRLADQPTVQADIHTVLRRAFADDPELLALAEDVFP